ncbi:TolB family protein [Kineococcus sp. TBRC 1896]|uniref:TolB family protein n=1 Tax=Kineococcus mangrovi TaxID=1660183 RepID=A0ABV4I3V0_9ACTN
MANSRELAPGQVARIHVHDVVTGEDVVVHESHDVLYEAPNWSWTRDELLLNGDGALWRLGLAPGAGPERIEHEGLPPINNDHVLDPDGEHVFCSAGDGHVYRAPLAGGPAVRVTDQDGVWHFLHGVSPDGKRLAYVRMTSFEEPGRLALLAADGSSGSLVDTGPGHVDGPEWSGDGAWIYFNTERWAARPGHAQLARVPDGGGEVERLHISDTVDWFPHLAPDAATAVYLEFPTGTQGHPADRSVALVVVSPQDWSVERERIPLPGGQGTINVNSWAPDSRRFAYVSYPVRG